MSSGGGSSAALRALPGYGQNGRPKTDLRGFVKTGAVGGDKDHPGVLDSTKSSVRSVKLDPGSGKYVVDTADSPSYDESQSRQRAADELNSRNDPSKDPNHLTRPANSKPLQSYVNVAGSKTTLGG